MKRSGTRRGCIPTIKVHHSNHKNHSSKIPLPCPLNLIFDSEPMVGRASSVTINTFDNVRACAAAFALELQHNVIPAQAGNHRGVAVGYDTRFQSEEFARGAAEVIANHGIPVQISDRPLPTPASAMR